MTTQTFDDINLSIIGIASEYPPFNHDCTVLDRLCKQHYPESASLDKVRMINRYTGIDNRSAIVPDDCRLVNMDRAPNITELCEVFQKDGVALAVAAAKKALHEAQTPVSEITHMVSTTCTNSANPGFDHYVMKELGITQPIEKVLLQGIGCSGGLASLRTAANLALGHSFRGLPARILVVALDICSLLVRSELDSIVELEEARIGVTLFSDCGSSLVLSNGLGSQQAEPVYELLGWDHMVLPNTEDALRFNAHPNGWKVVLTPSVPAMACEVVKPSFDKLMSSLPNLPPNYKKASDFDWALHPGGSTILTGVAKTMELTPEHMRASYDIYMNHGNSSSPTALSVLSRLREKEMDVYAPEGKVKDFVVGCAFGPGITVEICMLKRNLNHVQRTLRNAGDMTPPETESEGGRSEADEAYSDDHLNPTFEQSMPISHPDPSLNETSSKSPKSTEIKSSTLTTTDSEDSKQQTDSSKIEHAPIPQKTYDELTEDLQGVELD